MRGHKIQRVASSLDTVHSLYEQINEIVDQQGVTLTRIESNTHEAKDNSELASKELKQAAAVQKTWSQRLDGRDLGTNCVVVWFGIVVVLTVVSQL